jgi:molybdate transport system substrate-binding protein
MAPPAKAAPRAPLVLAAASLQESLNAAADAWAARNHPRPILSFGGSSALARQILAGAPADLFISADEPWINAVAAKGLIRPGTRTPFLTNRLALVAPAGRPLKLRIGPGFALARALGDGRLAMADPDAVPAGRYGREALTILGVWREVQPRIARAENVRAALALVERDEAVAGIVYATDARASRAVRVVGLFPEASHPPITYPLASLITSTNPEAEGFRRFLISRAGKAIFARFGFLPR